MRTTYTGARPYGTVDGARLYQYMECTYEPLEMVPYGYGEEPRANGWGELHDRYEDSTGHHFVWRRDLERNTLAIGFGNVITLDQMRGLTLDHTTILGGMRCTRVTWESVDQLVDFIEKDRWTIIGVFHMYTSGIFSSHSEIIMIRFEDDTPVDVVYPHEKVLGRVQRVLAL